VIPPIVVRHLNWVGAQLSRGPPVFRYSLNLVHTHLLLRRSFRLICAAAVALAASVAFAATHVVESIADLQAQIDHAQPGDTIAVKNGKYTTTNSLHVRCVGIRDRLITIEAEIAGGVEIDGSGGFEVDAPASFVVIRGFKFTHQAGHEIVAGGASHIRFTRNTFLCVGEGAYLTVTGDDVEVDHNELRDKKTLGNMISVTGVGAQVARRLWIHHNYFHDFANAHGNGAETIRFGLSGLSMSTGSGVVEYNLFVRCTGENELISNKSCGNTYRYNTFLDSRGAQLTIRHGNDCVVYANIFRGLDGLRIFGDRHLIFSNYFEGNTRGINLGNGDGEVADGAKLTSHDRPDNCVIVFNTLVNNRAQYQMDGRTKAQKEVGMGATHTTFAYNVIQGGEVAVEMNGANKDPVWIGNIVWQSGDMKALPATGFTSADPLLAKDANGIYRPQKGSPLLHADVAEFPRVIVDMDGQPRPAKKSIGADEPSEAPTFAHLLTPAEVGLSAP
jgi:poly(beta-D-mannuronate) lyase